MEQCLTPCFSCFHGAHFLALAKVQCGKIEQSQLKNGQFGAVGKLLITWPLQCLCHWKGKGSRRGECVAGAARGQDSSFDGGVGLNQLQDVC